MIFWAGFLRSGTTSARLGKLCDGLPGRSPHAIELIHSPKPVDEVGPRPRQCGPFRCLGKNVHVRRDHQVGKSYPVRCKLGLVAKQARKLPEHGMCQRHGRGNGRLIWSKPHELWSHYSVKADDSIDALK